MLIKNLSPYNRKFHQKTEILIVQLCDTLLNCSLISFLTLHETSIRMSKLPDVGTTIFTVMSKLASEHKAINLSQGFPNFPVDEKLKSILKEKVKEKVHQYMPMPGDEQLRKKVSTMIEKQYDTSSNLDNILITAGATQGLFTTIMALIENGDEVIILDPSYDSYDPAVRLAGGVPKRIHLNGDFTPNWHAVNNAITAKTKMIITNNPHNPSGRIWEQRDLDHMERIMSYHPELIWLSDEVYEFITFEGRHLSAHHLPKFSERIIITSSFGKTFHVTGWKIGYIFTQGTLMEEIKKVHEFNVFCVNSVSQAVLSEYLDHIDVNQLGPFYQKKRDLFRSLLAESKFELLPCEGTYFQAASYASISDAPDTAFCKELTTKFGVAAIPMSVFNADGTDNKTIRFCFAKDDNTLIKAAKKLCRI